MKCPRDRSLLEEHTGRHWYGSPQRTPDHVDTIEAVRDLRRTARREALKLARDGARLP